MTKKKFWILPQYYSISFSKSTVHMMETSTLDRLFSKKMLDVVSSCHLFFVLSRISAKRYIFFSYCNTMCHYEWNLYFMHIFTNCVLQITFFHYCIYRIIVYWFYIIIQFISYKLHKVIKKPTIKQYHWVKSSFINISISL